MSEIRGTIFNIQRFSVQDGPGIRTTVFVKGCPLLCPWCSNPESQQFHFEVAHVESLCQQCGRCVAECELQAITLTPEMGISIDRDKCNNCGKCIEVCPNNAMKMFGEEVTVEEVYDIIAKDRLYYQSSGGGMTISGGEPLTQARFAAALFERCQRAGIHTTMDTTGYGSQSDLEMVLPHIDLVLFDLKVIDPTRHKAIVKVSNNIILRNAKHIVESGTQMIIRVPLIPGLTDADENIENIADFVCELGGNIPVNILPYHRFGMGKYAMLNRAYPLQDTDRLPDERLEAILEYIQSHGLTCEVVI